MASGKNVCLVATYSRDYYHQLLDQLINETLVCPFIFCIQTPDLQIPTRLSKRNNEKSRSNIRSLTDYIDNKSRFKPHPKAIIIENSKAIDEALNEVKKNILN